MTDWNFRNLQAEQAPWVKHNFGDRPAWMPLMGMVEEICDEWTTAPSKAAVADAIADAAIFMADFCTAVGIDMQAIDDVTTATMVGEDGVIPAVGRLAHSFLKMEQGIRGSKEEHMEAIAKNLSSILLSLRLAATSNGCNLIDLVREVWGAVKERDFKANVRTGRA